MDTITLLFFAFIMCIVMLAVYGLLQYRRLSIVLKFLIIIPALGCAEEPDPFSIIELPSSQPVVFPELPKATITIDTILLGQQNGSDLNMSAWDRAWLEFLNETNMTV